MSVPTNADALKELEAPMHILAPSVAHSQDVRHVLARSFRELYTREIIRPDTINNLRISKETDDAYHERYVNNLLKVNTEWQQRMDEIAMLERHIMQAQAKAMSADERELNRASTSCDNYKTLGLPPVKASFRSCIDTKLLRDYHLLTPSDYLVPDPSPVPAPVQPETPSYAIETTSSLLHHRQSNDYNVISSGQVTDKAIQTSFLYEESQGDFKNQDQKKEKQDEFPKKNRWKEYLSEDQREADRKYLEMLQAKANFMRNPRHIPGPLSSKGRSLIKALDKKLKVDNNGPDSHTEADLILFVPEPPVVEFRNYKVGEVYEITLELKNVSSVMQQCRMLPPSSSAFSVGLGQFPGDSGLVAPGMSCTYGVRFTPDSLRNYDDYITVQTQAVYPLVIPLKANRPPPELTLPSEVDIGSCLVYEAQTTQLLIKNVGGHGRFCLMPRNKWPTASIRSVLPNVTKTTIRQPPFEIYPATFELEPGQSVALEVIFSPQSEKPYIQDMTIACDNCQVSHFKLKGEGEIARVSLVDVEMGLSEPQPGEFIDVSTKYLVKFEDLNPYTYTERIAKINNCTKTELYYQWMVYKPIVTSCFSDVRHNNNVSEEERVPDLQSAFSVYPSNGVLQPSQTMDFKLTFAPAAEGNLHSVVHMLIQNAPPHKRGISPTFNRNMTVYEMEALADEDNMSDPGGFLPFKDITALGVEMKGKCVPLNVVLHPYALIIQAPILRGSSVKKLFTMANHSYSSITFRWESYTDSYFIEIEPPFGDLEPGMAMDFEISVTGVEPGVINHTMLCHILNMAEPLCFLVQADIMGPELKIEEPSINFGLIRVGQCEMRQMTIINASETVVKFTITDCAEDNDCDDKSVPRELTISETSGELKPFARKTVTLTMTPEFAHTIRRMCIVEYEGGKTCVVGVYCEAQTPVVCFLECDIFIPEVYLDVPAVFTVLLHNQTLLPTTYKWGMVSGPQCGDCLVEVVEVEGEILSWQQKTISIAFTALKPVSFSNVILPCHVAGQAEDIYLRLNCDVKTLAVSFKTSSNGKEFMDGTKLNFGDKVCFGQTVTRYVMLCNQTAIPSKYSVRVEHFEASAVSLQQFNETDTISSQRRSLLSQTTTFGKALFRKSTGQMVQDYNKQILSNGRGLAFVVYPSEEQLQPYGREMIEISAHNDMWGIYHDNLIFKVGDLQEVKIPMDINVVGCPLSFQVTGGVHGEETTVRFGSQIADSGAITRKLRINNDSPVGIRVDWQMYKCVDNENKLLEFITYFGRAFPRRDIFGTEITHGEVAASKSVKEVTKPDSRSLRVIRSSDHLSSISEDTIIPKEAEGKTRDVASGGRSQVVFCCLRPHNGIISKTPFSIRPSQIVIPSRSSVFVDVTFNPHSISEVPEEMTLMGYAEGFMSLDNEDVSSHNVTRPEAYDAERLTVNLSAHLRPPVLTVENLTEGRINFTAAVSDLFKDNEIVNEFLHTYSLKLRNDTQASMTFKMRVKEPFLLVDVDPSSTKQASNQATETEFCTLKSGHYLMTKVAFRVSEQLFPEISTKSREGVCQKIPYEDELTIMFVNGSVQKVPLHACLTIPQLEVSEECLDFGTCLVGQTCELTLDICNTTTSHCCWKICLENKSETCDDETFKVQPETGVLEAYVTHVSKSKATVRVFFTAKHSDAYDCTLTLYGLLGEHARRVIVVGQGSYDGKYEAVVSV